MQLVILCVDIAWNAIETFTEGGGFVSKHLGNQLLSTKNQVKVPKKGIKSTNY